MTTAAGQPAALDLRGVEVLAGGRTILAVEAFAVGPGENVALIGPNGAGKTTLLHVAAALLRPDRGEVRLGGETVTPGSERRLRRTAALVFQSPLLFSTSVLDNVASGLRFRGVPRSEANAAAGAWLDRFGIAALAERRPAGLSGGEAQRVSLARAFATEPRLVLLDEPFAALDPPTRQSLVPVLQAELRRAGAAAILVSHDLGEALAFGDRVGVLLDGRIAQIALPADLLARPASLAVARLLGTENLWPATRVSGEGASSRWEVAPGLTWCVSSGAGGDGRGTVTVRAASVAARPAGCEVAPGEHAIDGVVASVVPTPWGERVWIEGPVTIEAHRRGGDAALAVGDRVRAIVPVAAVHVVPEHDLAPSWLGARCEDAPPLGEG